MNLKVKKQGITLLVLMLTLPMACREVGPEEGQPELAPRERVEDAHAAGSPLRAGDIHGDTGEEQSGNVSEDHSLAQAWQTYKDVTSEQVRQNLALEAKLKTPETVKAGGHVGLDMFLVNRSKAIIYPVVKPGDGSAEGWREPHVYYTALIDRGDGSWVPVPKNKYGRWRCGLFDSHWQKDVVGLGAGEKLTLRNWLCAPSEELEFQQAGRVRLFVHYAYRGGKSAKGEKSTGQPADSDCMRDMPEFDVVSDPIEFEVVRPLDLVVVVKRFLVSQTTAMLSDIADAFLVNRSQEPIQVSSPTIRGDAQLWFEMEGKHHAWVPRNPTQRSARGTKRMLVPGEEVPVLGKGDFSNDMDWMWDYPAEGTVKLRAAYCKSKSKSSPVVKSDWVEIEVVE